MSMAAKVNIQHAVPEMLVGICGETLIGYPAYTFPYIRRRSLVVHIVDGLDVDILRVKEE